MAASRRGIRLPVENPTPDPRFALTPVQNMSLSIHEVPPTDAPLALLLLADPSESKVRAYLPGRTLFRRAAWTAPSPASARW